MNAFVNSFFPLIALIGLGWLCRRRGLVGPTAARELTLFVVWLALPALLFEGTSTASLQQLWQPRFLVAYSAGMVLTFAVILPLSASRLGFVDRCLDALGASYANSGFIGISLAVLLMGHEALLPATIATLMTACVSFAGTIALIEIAGGRGTSTLASLGKAGRALATNPLVVATVAGIGWSATGWSMPTAPHRLLELLSGAAGPCALVSIGALLSEPAPQGEAATIVPVVVGKLFLQPAICALLAYGVFDLPPVWAKTAVLLSALPTGTGPFMLAEFYKRDAARASRVMFVTTALSLVTMSAAILLLH